LFGKLRLSHFEEALDLLAVEVTIEVHVQPNKQLFDASFTSPGEPTVDLIGSEKRDIVWLRRSKVGSEERKRDKRQQVRESVESGAHLDCCRNFPPVVQGTKR
jgi:hypothetical protein